MREFIYTGGPPRKAWRPKAKVWRFLSFWPSLSHAQLNIPWPRSVVGRYAILRALQPLIYKWEKVPTLIRP